MSQGTLHEPIPGATPDPPAESKPVASDLPASKDVYELDYQPMPLMAPVALFLGIASFAALMGLFGLILAAVGVLVGIGSMLQIKASQGRYSGMKLSVIGFSLSAVFLLLGTRMMIADYHAELPPGFSRVNFPQQIAEKEFVYEKEVLSTGQTALVRKIHPEVKPFVDQKIFVKGYIWQQQSIESGFILLKDNGECCFGGNPAPNDMIYVHLTERPNLKDTTGLIAVAGVLRADPSAQPGAPVYTMEVEKGEHVARAKTVF